MAVRAAAAATRPPDAQGAPALCVLVVFASSPITPSATGPSVAPSASASASSLGTSAPAVASSTTSSPVPTPQSSPVLGGTNGGLPASIDGQPVLPLPAAARALTASTTDRPVLVGGWFHRDGPAWWCPASGNDPPWGTCLRFALYQQPTGVIADTIRGPVWWYGQPPTETMLVFLGSLLIDQIGPYTANRPVVLSIHTHDPACVQGLKILGEDCRSQPVVDAVIWAGTPR